MSATWSSYLAAIVLSLGSLLACTRFASKSRYSPDEPCRLLGLIVAIFTGLLVLLSPLDELSDRLFSAHMVEHELLLFTMPIGLLAARPLPIALIAPWRLLPSTWRRSVGRGWNWWRQSLRGLSVFEQPIPALALSTSALWAWHAPPLYDLALRSEWIHTLEHVSFLVTALLFWRPLLSVAPVSSLDSNAKRALYLMAGGMQGGLLGALIALDNHVIYTGYLTVPGAPFAAVLADQQVGGAVMWFSGPIFCGIISAIVMK